MIYVVHCKQVPNHEYIGRPSPLGNPFVWDKSTPKGSTLPSYRKWLREQIALGNKAVLAELDRLEAIARQGDLYVGCWCAPGPCHGDVIKEVLEERMNQPKLKEKVESGMNAKEVLARFMELGNMQLRGEILSLDLAEEFNDLRTVMEHLNLKSYLPSKFKPFLLGEEEVAARVQAEPESIHSEKPKTKPKQVAIIGSRDITEDQFEYLVKVAEAFANRGYIVRTGGADGADHAAMLGTRHVDPSLLRVYLPWDGYNKQHIEETDLQFVYDPKEDIEWSQSVYKYHPAPQSLSRGGFALMSRNWGIVMHDEPVDVVVAYPTSTSKTGGTGQGMRIAKGQGIELFTVCEKEERVRLKEFLKGGKKKVESSVKIVKGNLLDHQGIIVHQVNCQGVMKAGVAKDIRAKWPAVYTAYKKVASPDILGRAQFVKVGDHQYVVNLFGQDNYGRGEVQTDYKAFRKACKEIKKKLEGKASVPIGFPYGIGCGLAGGDWTLVSQIIEEELAGLDVTLYQYAPPSNGQTLECSSKGDKRFSAFYAKVTVFGKTDSIENHYQLAKRFNGEAPKDWRDAKGKQPTTISLNGHSFPTEKLSDWYKILWLLYLDQHPVLVTYASGFDDFTDMFRGKAINCQADVIKQYIKEGRASIEKECAKLLAFVRKHS